MLLNLKMIIRVSVHLNFLCSSDRANHTKTSVFSFNKPRLKREKTTPDWSLKSEKATPGWSR